MGWMAPTFLALLPAPILAAVEPPSWGELGVYFAAIVAVVGVIYTATVTGKTGREANAVNFSNTLMKRIGDLEDDRDTDRKELKEVKGAQEVTDKKLTETLAILSVALDFISDLYTWGRRGGGEPEPAIPGQLREWLGHLIRKDN